jgi:hypothetical protein
VQEGHLVPQNHQYCQGKATQNCSCTQCRNNILIITFKYAQVAYYLPKLPLQEKKDRVRVNGAYYFELSTVSSVVPSTLKNFKKTWLSMR